MGGIGVIGMTLVALPLVAAMSGIGTKALRYSYANGFTKEITGQFLRTPHGNVKLFDWRDPQSPYPADALRVHARDFRMLVVRAAAVDRPGAYQLFDVDRGRSVPLEVVRQSHTSLALAPKRTLPPRRYMIVASQQGMFGDRNFIYLRVVPRGAAVTP